MSHEYPEISTMTKRDVREALNLAYTNGADGSFLKPEARPDFLQRLAALKARYRELGGKRSAPRRRN